MALFILSHDSTLSSHSTKNHCWCNLLPSAGQERKSNEGGKEGEGVGRKERKVRRKERGGDGKKSSVRQRTSSFVFIFVFVFVLVPMSHCVAQATLENTILLPWPLQSQGITGI